MEGAGGSSLQPRRQWQWCWQPTAASTRASNDGRSRGSAKQTTINQKAVAIAAETVLVAAETAAAVAVAAAMATAAMAVTMRQPWQW